MEYRLSSFYASVNVELLPLLLLLLLQLFLFLLLLLLQTLHSLAFRVKPAVMSTFIVTLVS